MRRPLLTIVVATLATSILTSLVAVYVLHDVDQDQLTHLHRAFAISCEESLVFTIVIGGATAALTVIAKSLLHLQQYVASSTLGALLGTLVTICQYVWDLVARNFFPNSHSPELLLYLLLAIVASTSTFVLSSLGQRNRARHRGVIDVNDSH